MITIKPFYYHKTISEDQITHKVDLSERYIAYSVSFNNTYWNCENEDQCKKEIIQDLLTIRNQLETELNKRLEINKRMVKKC